MACSGMLPEPRPVPGGRLLRRAWTGLALALLLAPRVGAETPFETAMAKVEARMPGRMGVFALQGNRVAGYRSGERFAYCSAFKWFLAAAVLERCQAGALSLEQAVPYTRRDLPRNSPVLEAFLKQGRLSIGELCAAAITVSDNGATNLLERRLGGPAGLQRFARSLGDPVIRFDRMETELNTNRKGDPRDTTTPEAMARLLQKVLEGDTLTPASKTRLLDWMKAVRTGQARIRAGAPQGWAVADKTGTGEHGAVNDVAALFPPSGDTVYLVVFTDGDGAVKAHEAAIAEAAREAVAALARHGGASQGGAVR